jgi:hypothetical protein
MRTATFWTVHKAVIEAFLSSSRLENRTFQTKASGGIRRDCMAIRLKGILMREECLEKWPQGDEELNNSDANARNRKTALIGTGDFNLA